MIKYKSVNLKKWTVLAPIKEEILSSVVLVHVFGYEAESAYFVTSNDEVFALGENVLGRLGIGNVEIISTQKPIRLNKLCGKHVICFTTGSIHALALTKSGDVYSWGSNNYGQLGHNSLDSQLSPKRIIFPGTDVQIKKIATADRYSLALTSNNELYHWGDVQWDCCSTQTVPTLLKIWHDPTIVSISCGAFHAVALTDCGKVLAWGVNEAGQLGNGNTILQDVPQVIRGQLEDQNVIEIVCSTLATMALTDDGVLYAWGHNKNSSLAVGVPMEIVYFPQRVIIRKNIVRIAANNLQPILVAEAEKPHEVFLWAQEDEDSECAPRALPCSNILEAFYGISMPIVGRKSEEPVLPMVPLLKGSTRDIGKVLFDSKEYSDLQIQLADGVVYVHTIIMRAFCEHFKTLLDENWSNGRTVINMKQYNSKAYRAFLKYVYTGIVEPLEGSEIIALCDIAMSYLELELKNLSQEMFKYCLTVSNVAQLYAIAAGNQSELVESCVQFAAENLDSVILSEGFESLDPALSKSLVSSAIKLKHGLL
ncbi:RCC1 and BTB domain-containing protein 1 isoform X2 [Halyomorpha halys]|uniref:RCC1 and BTB domain-containing protein 1 isoform X2 n=1 Tax=Halyomorpha halys TaxID=286706 RepID=UPI0006D51021|nr:RCC1 and BTB domain-containing protein 1-like isoform X2 [Halyomorpha halys]